MADCGFTAENSVVNRYIKSLYEVSMSLGIEKIVLTQMKSIKDYVAVIDNYEKYLKKFSLMTKSGENFISMLKDELNLSKEVGNFLDLLLKNHRLSLLMEICDAYLSFVDKIKGKKIFYITYAKGFSKSDEKRLAGDLRAVFGGEIECVSVQDPLLVGGIKIQFRSKILDYSVKSRLARLSSAIRGDNYEN
ncbi:MAG: ATP synthase F1 subunit delta [Holosporaceae bacterium]|nr:ATP synthase F1 subunit delta [Holosporaceae bacterium]